MNFYYNNNDYYDEEYDYNISFLRTSCENCWIIFDINKVAGVYRLKDNTLSLCDNCYFQIQKQHVKRGQKWEGVESWKRVVEDPDLR